jgi:hypothetical protein
MGACETIFLYEFLQIFGPHKITYVCLCEHKRPNNIKLKYVTRCSVCKCVTSTLYTATHRHYDRKTYIGLTHTTLDIKLPTDTMVDHTYKYPIPILTALELSTD